MYDAGRVQHCLISSIKRLSPVPEGSFSCFCALLSALRLLGEVVKLKPEEGLRPNIRFLSSSFALSSSLPAENHHWNAHIEL